MSNEHYEKDPNVEHLREVAREFCGENLKPNHDPLDFNPRYEIRPHGAPGKEKQEAEKNHSAEQQQTAIDFNMTLINPSSIIQNTEDAKKASAVRPGYYTFGRKYEPKDVIRDWSLNFNLGCAVKYIARVGKKPGVSAEQDLRKAKQYIEFELEWISNHPEEGK